MDESKPTLVERKINRRCINPIEEEERMRDPLETNQWWGIILNEKLGQSMVCN